MVISDRQMGHPQLAAKSGALSCRLMHSCSAMDRHMQHAVFHAIAFCRIFMSRIFHPCNMVPHFHVPQFHVSHFQRPLWSKVQTCIRLSWCHCQSLSLALVKSRLVLLFWYQLTWVVPEKGPLNGCVCVCVCSITVVKQSQSEEHVYVNNKKQQTTKNTFQTWCVNMLSVPQHY